MENGRSASKGRTAQKWASVCLAALAIVAGCFSQQSGDPVEKRIQSVEEGLTEFSSPAMLTRSGRDEPQKTWSLAERQAHYKVPAVSLAVIRDGKIDWAKAYGVLKAGSAEPADTDTYFQAASSTKLLTAAIVLRCAEKGLLDLDRDVNDYLKSWKIPESDHTREKKVTLKLLLTHQAGVNRPPNGFSWEDGKTPTLQQVLKGEPPAENEPAEVVFPPGSKWEYSNMGYVIIQQVLEDVLGKPFALIADEEVFQPLGMTRSTLIHPLPEDRRAAEAVPHDEEGKAHKPVMVPGAVAHGGLMTTPSDLAAFAIELMRAYQGKSDILFSRKTARAMFAKVLDLDPALLGLPLAEGLGVFLYRTGEQLTFAHPGGNYPGSNCWIVGVPDKGRGAVIMTNAAQGELLAIEILAAVSSAYDWAAD